MSEKQSTDWTSVSIGTGIVIGIILILGLVFRIMFCNFIDNYEFAYKYDSINGTLESVNKKGYYVSWPFVVSVHTIDLRPTQVCINANSRVLNCKLVQFDTTGWKTFVAWHGRKDYDNTPSSTGAPGSTGSLSDILLSYAYDGTGRSYPFLKVLRELKTEQSVDKPTDLKMPADTTHK